MEKLFHDWKFDIRSAVVTVLLLPLLVFLLKLILRHLKIWSAYAVEGVMYWVARVLIHSLAASFTLRRYCRLQLSSVSPYLHVPSSHEIKLHIDKVYVTLTMDSPGSKTNYNHHDVLAAGNRIRVVGDPGSGKSSLVKRLFRDACEAGLENPRKSRLPILVELKNVEIPSRINSKQLGQWFYQLLRRQAREHRVYKMDECFDSYAETVGLLVLLDGLDEVSTTDYHRMRDAIRRLSTKLSQLGSSSVIVLTMRTQFHQQVKQDFREAFAQTMFLKPFTPSDIYDFLTRWPFERNQEQNRSRIYKELTDRPTLREMCSNPLILSMYVAEDQAAGHIVAPETRTEFYSKVIEELLIRRRLQQTGPTVATSKLREQRQRILGQLAYEHLLDENQSINVLPWSEAIRIVQKVTRCSEATAITTFRELAKETGLVTEERVGQTFRFIHLTVCEFLAAYECVQGQRAGWEQLLQAQEKFHQNDNPQLRTRLAEVIPFAAGLLPRVRRYDAVTDVSKLSDSRLMTLTFLETKLYDHPFWSVFSSAERSSLLGTPEDQWDQSWLRRLHLFNVVITDANQGARHLPVVGGQLDLQKFFQSLVAKQQSSLSILLSSYAAQDAAAAFRLAEICKLDVAAQYPEVIVNNCDQLPFFDLVSEQALQEIGRAETWASIFAEAALRSRAVANTLKKKSPASEYSEILASLPKRSKWFRSPMDRSFLTQMVSIAVESQHKGGSPTTFPLVRCIAAFPPPGPASTLPFFLSLIASLLIMIIATVLYIQMDHSNFFPRIIILVALFVTAYALMLVSTAKIGRARLAYSELLQIDRPTEDVLARAKREPVVALRYVLYGARNRSHAEAFFGKKHSSVLNLMNQIRSHPDQ